MFTFEQKEQLIETLEHMASTQRYVFEICEEMYSPKDARILNALDGLNETAASIHKLKSLLE